jgi:hypothetical protein
MFHGSNIPPIEVVEAKAVQRQLLILLRLVAANLVTTVALAIALLMR